MLVISNHKENLSQFTKGFNKDDIYDVLNLFELPCYIYHVIYIMFSQDISLLECFFNIYSGRIMIVFYYQCNITCNTIL